MSIDIAMDTDVYETLARGIDLTESDLKNIEKFVEIKGQLL